MEASGWLIAATVAFVATHFLLSHPLRAAIVARLGERGFLVLYSLVAAATLGWTVWAYRAAPTGTPWGSVDDGLWAVATVLMLVASVLLMGSLVGNPALPDPTGATAPSADARVWLVATWAHLPLAGWPAAIWRWIG